MTLREFVGHLDSKDGLDLEFTVSGRKISGSYHITEIKSARIESVDCGGVQNRWTRWSSSSSSPAETTRRGG